MVRAVTILIVFLQLPQLAKASQERILSPSKVVITAVAGEPFGEVTTEIETITRPDLVNFRKIQLKVGDKWESVPEKGLVDLGFWLLNKVELRTEKRYDDSPWLYVYLEITSMVGPNQFVVKKVHFGYHKNKFESRSISTPSEKGQERWEQIKF